MKFAVQSSLDKVVGTASPEFVLQPGGWDDFSHHTSFSLYQRVKDSEPKLIGSLKIIERSPKRSEDGKFRPAVPRKFDTLGPKFVSLGQDENFYRTLLSHLGQSRAKEILESLSDIAWTPDLAKPFDTCSAFRNSLIRYTTAQRARRMGRPILLGETVHDSAAFRYRARIPGAAAPLSLLVHFDPEDKIPGRVACLIGRNAVGKTQVLAALATDLTQITRKSQKEVEERDDRFHGKRPLFTRVIAVSYSAFDKFTRSKAIDTGYVYCGLRNEKGSPSMTHLTKEFEFSLQRVIEAGRFSTWKRAIRQILDRTKDADLRAKLESVDVDDFSHASFLDGLSSGEAILTHLTTALVSWLEPYTLVLFDEPETHLHPNAVASLVNVLTELLKEHESFALIATHSPIVLQEIPRKRVLVLSREGDVTVASNLDLESFGESLSILTRHVFDTNEIENLYKSTLSELADEETFEQTLERFDGELSQNAIAYLLAKHASGSKE